jgi:superfamily I DNA/RNA helicase
MRLQNWFISNLDDSQRQIIVQDPNKNLIVQGSAGSGKTNLAIHRAQQASTFGSYVILVYTIALKKMVQYGLKKLGLDKDRVVYEWSWDHRGLEVSGDVFCLKGGNSYGLEEDLLIVFDTELSSKRYFLAYKVYETSTSKGNFKGEKFEKIVEPLEISIDFGDWVENRFYYTFLRRSRWFREVKMPEFEFQPTTDKFVFIPTAFIFKRKTKVDYMIIDEAQDFSISDFQGKFLPDVNKSLTLFGDTQQKIYSNRGVSLDDLQSTLQYPRYLLSFNYRLPKAIAKVAQTISSPPQDLMTNNRKNQGNSDYPNFDKPVIRKFDSREKELDYILATINMEGLDDVAILLPENDDVIFVHKYLEGKNVGAQVRYTQDIPQNRVSGTYPFFRTVDTLQFENNDLACLLTYHSAKGTEFENVFVPFANQDEIKSRSAFFVAVSRASGRVFITYSKNKTEFLNNVNPDHINQG